MANNKCAGMEGSANKFQKSLSYPERHFVALQEFRHFINILPTRRHSVTTADRGEEMSHQQTVLTGNVAKQAGNRARRNVEEYRE